TYLEIGANPKAFDGEMRSWYVVFRPRLSNSGRMINTGYKHFTQAAAANHLLHRIKYNHPGLIVNLAVGLSSKPLPMDYDGDGRDDLVVSGSGTDSRGTYLFKRAEAPAGTLLFKPAQWLMEETSENTQW